MKLSVKMSMTISVWKKALFLFLFLGLAIEAEAASKMNDGRGRLSSYEFHQNGDADLVVGILGRNLPQPDVTHLENNKTRIVLPNVSGEQVSAEHRQNTAPMVLNVSGVQDGSDYVITFTTERPLRVRTVRGVPPSDSFAIRMVTEILEQKMIEEPVKTAQPQTLQTPTGPFAVNTPITLDLRDADLRDVFRLLGLQLKKNIIIDDSLPPGQTVTMTVKDVPLSEVYSYLMKSYNVSYEMMGQNTVIIGTRDGISKLEGKQETRAYRIAYATPTALAGLLPRLTSLGNDGFVVDERLRTIYATASPEIHEEVAIAIQKLDHPGKQIMLQARILEFTDGVTTEVESALNGVYDHWWFSYTGQKEGKFGYVDDNRQSRPAGAGNSYTGSITSDVTTMITPMQGVWREFDAGFRALETRGKGKTLANPSVITIDGQEASISLTEDYPYISGRDDGGNATWSRETVGPQLKMTPRVGRDEFVTIQLDIQTGDVIEMITGSTGEQMPRTSTRSLTTNVRVRDGEPFVVGGLFRENSTQRRVRVPVLGSIPIVGEIFTFRFRDHQKTQAVIVVVPYILDTPDIAVEHERVMLRQ